VDLEQEGSEAAQVGVFTKLEVVKLGFHNRRVFPILVGTGCHGDVKIS
jgi:hypothetical protein